MVNRYGIVDYDRDTNNFKMIVEKPDIGKAPSNMADFGRFILNHKTVKQIVKKETGKSGELWLVDSITKASNAGAKFKVHEVIGKWLTTGDPLSYMKTQVLFALERSDMGSDFSEFLRSLPLEKYQK